MGREGERGERGRNEVKRRGGGERETGRITQDPMVHIMKETTKKPK